MMKGVIIIIVFALDVVVILINISALVLLTYSKKNNLRGSQRILLIALCETELVYSATDLVGYVFYVLNVREGLIALLSSNSTSVTFFYVTIMMLIPIDRFLEIHLNIKYNIHWSPNKDKDRVNCCTCSLHSFIHSTIFSKITKSIFSAENTSVLH